jgi:uncharacterized coiled-coil protein SlyX
MATVEQLSDQIAALTTALAQTKVKIDEDIAHLRSLIEGAVDPADLDPIIAQLNALTESVQAIDPDTSFPPAEG